MGESILKKRNKKKTKKGKHRTGRKKGRKEGRKKERGITVGKEYQTYSVEESTCMLERCGYSIWWKESSSVRKYSCMRALLALILTAGS